MLGELIREALRNLAHHKLRSLLTALGIIFGIASVMSMVSTGEGARRAILEQIEELGIRNVILNAKKPPLAQKADQKEEGSNVLRYGLTFRDAEQIEETLPMVARVLPVRDEKKWVWFRANRLQARLRGVTPEYFEQLRLEPIAGRVLTELDGERRRRVCVVRADLFERAKYPGEPLRTELRVGAQYYQVVGVLPAAGFKGHNRAALGIDDRSLEVYVPFRTVRDRYGLVEYSERAGGSENTRVELHQIVCVALSEDRVVAAARAIKAILDKNHRRPDYEMVVPVELLASRQRTQRVFNIVLPIIAGISLLVGGIGILNIMLASITERTKEIGIRRAIGATRADITWQFLIETMTLTGIGGVLGVLLGGAGALLIGQLTDWKPVITMWAVGLSLTISGLTGIVFGLYPARRAATMDPIRALRHE